MSVSGASAVEPLEYTIPQLVQSTPYMTHHEHTCSQLAAKTTHVARRGLEYYCTVLRQRLRPVPWLSSAQGASPPGPVPLPLTSLTSLLDYATVMPFQLWCFWTLSRCCLVPSGSAVLPPPAAARVPRSVCGPRPPRPSPHPPPRAHVVNHV